MFWAEPYLDSTTRKAAGFEWNKGNRKKCKAHGVSIAEIEDLFTRPVMVLPDPAHSHTETRMRTIDKTKQSRSVFTVFTIRMRGLSGKRLSTPNNAGTARAISFHTVDYHS